MTVFLTLFVAPHPPATNATKLPTRYGWMLRLYPGHQIPGARSQLAHLLTEPDMIALITAHPSLGRVLRPLCHMLHLAPPPHLALPRKPPPVTPRKPRAKPARPPRAQHRPSRSTSECRPLWGLHDLPARPRNNRA
ncbi:MAG TPA: hypothetical protein PK677_01100 [Acidiphilium sp.]|nr:MAG: hypothetical protein B7Z67_03970 [Acidiphilium sp. 21-60-14]OYV91239.1 MAG: hypothetical protein B7Z57_06325 [Acidiphilium sp. 37-60-79]OZB39824.1 MAG: hypothetical protein B7X48_07100 [Acidiphilium sp. 34-60-192]HQT87133.1 hypothetical protein [Acidiphilium sp.]HQU24499.1 hypothetical protein [Acidiphilium sp.]